MEERSGLLPAPLRASRRLTGYDLQHRNAVRPTHRLKVPIAMGTDAGPPGDHHGDNAQQIVEWVTGTVPTPAAAIHAATLKPAKPIGRGQELGGLEAGKRADAVTFSRDPLADVMSLRQVGFMMKGGMIHTRPAAKPVGPVRSESRPTAHAAPFIERILAGIPRTNSR